jgi:hypothetical protein
MTPDCPWSEVHPDNLPEPGRMVHIRSGVSGGRVCCTSDCLLNMYEAHGTLFHALHWRYSESTG